MKRLSAALAVAALAVAATPASAVPGVPGTTFPEQPGSHVQNACQTLLAAPGQGLVNRAPIAAQITVGNFLDACSPG